METSNLNKDRVFRKYDIKGILRSTLASVLKNSKYRLSALQVTLLFKR